MSYIADLYDVYGDLVQRITLLYRTNMVRLPIIPQISRVTHEDLLRTDAPMPIREFRIMSCFHSYLTYGEVSSTISTGQPASQVYDTEKTPIDEWEQAVHAMIKDVDRRRRTKGIS